MKHPLLSHAEHAEWVRAGALLKMAQLQVPAAAIQPLVKQADIKGVFNPLGSGLDWSAKAILAGSLITGIPIGIMAHMLSKQINTVKVQQRELDEKIKYYRQAGEGLETGMARAGVTA